MYWEGLRSSQPVEVYTKAVFFTILYTQLKPKTLSVKISAWKRESPLRCKRLCEDLGLVVLVIFCLHIHSVPENSVVEILADILRTNISGEA